MGCMYDLWWKGTDGKTTHHGTGCAEPRLGIAITRQQNREK